MNKEMAEEKIPFLRKITPFDKTGIPGKIRYLWGDGIETQLNIESVSEQNKTRAMYHGISQRTGDAVAGCSKSGAYDYARELMQHVFDLLQSPDWSKPGTGGKGETPQSIEDLIAAIAKLKKQPPEKVANVVRNASREERDVWRKHPAVAAELEEIAYKRAKDAAKGAEGFDFPID